MASYLSNMQHNNQCLPHVFLTHNKHPELTIYFPLPISAGNCHLQVISLMYILKITVQNKKFAQHLCIIFKSYAKKNAQNNAVRSPPIPVHYNCPSLYYYS